MLWSSPRLGPSPAASAFHAALPIPSGKPTVHYSSPQGLCPALISPHIYFPLLKIQSIVYWLLLQTAFSWKGSPVHVNLTEHFYFSLVKQHLYLTDKEIQLTNSCKHYGAEEILFPQPCTYQDHKSLNWYSFKNIPYNQPRCSCFVTSHTTAI